jgi:hypothetical protein
LTATPSSLVRTWDLCVLSISDFVRTHGYRCLKLSGKICPDTSQPKSSPFVQKVQNLSGLGSSLGRNNPGSCANELDFEELVRQLRGLSLPFQSLKWKQIVDFFTFVSRLKDPILLAQPAGVSVTEAPDVLPPSVATFLGGSCNITVSAVTHCWKILQMTIWTYTESDVEAAFAEHGVKHSLSMHHYILH